MPFHQRAAEERQQLQEESERQARGERSSMIVVVSYSIFL